MTIEIYVHEKDTSRDLTKIIDVTGKTIEVETICYNNGDERLKHIGQLSPICYGTPVQLTGAGSLIYCSFTDSQGKKDDFIILRGWLKIKDKGGLVNEFSNF